MNVNVVGIPGFQDLMSYLQYALSVKTHTGIRRERMIIQLKTGFEISLDLVNGFELQVLLSDREGFIDGDKRCLVIE